MGGIASNLADYVEAGNKTTIHNQDTFTEKEDLEEVLDCTFEEFKDENGNLSWSEIGQKFNGMGFGHIFNALEEKKIVSREEFKHAMRNYPRMQSRFQWVRALHLDRLLARQLKPGTLFDETKCIRSMNSEQIKEVLQNFQQAIQAAFYFELEKLKRREKDKSSDSNEADNLMNKFSGDFGKFGDTGMYQEGLESQIGSPDPYILKGIFRDHESKDLFMAPNYKIIFSPFGEYCRLFGHDTEYKSREDKIPWYLQEIAKASHKSRRGPSMAELKDLEDVFKKYRDGYQEISRKNQGVFPGDVFNLQKGLQIKFSAINDDSAKSLHSLISKRIDVITKKWIETSKIDIQIEAFVDACFAPSGKDFTVSFVTPFSSSPDKNFEELEKSVKNAITAQRPDGDGDEGASGLLEFTTVTKLVYMYVAKLEKNQDRQSVSTLPIKLPQDHVREVFEREELDLEILSQLSGLPKSDAVRAVHIDKILNDLKEFRIEPIQGRRRLSLRELMEKIPESEDGTNNLRVEEAIQAYQYTGPLFQVIVANYTSFAHVAWVSNNIYAQLWNGVLRKMPFPGTDAATRMSSAMLGKTAGIPQVTSWRSEFSPKPSFCY